ncbi:T9SS type A sorting domain-containing protein [Flavilitoribacter nigricans]|uniref:T9SS type A sorting domain-containing protein n=1 Tax=Flavilitoribacter nigricans (strain ATCC 23147 / DSM 23189 / NBRC 102662 / NCIMB 1420 / SS-2) TaxID=1122177 RepID=A0A2D0N1Q4_FLAN2|nr:T9SS type A sorting domain-containing protein [Flavilitoribacter nigricans]PHN02461.1 hypothetical protein CRP01_32280 [Flavilitoribacter nigricans DSM 23189 = NBRC 102662]
MTGLLCAVLCFSQINFTANQEVRSYRGGFRTGVNFGYYQGWTDEQLAAISVGDPALGQPGAGINSLRLTLPDHFLEFYDYDIRKEAFEYYAHLGSDENVLFIGHPSDAHRDRTQHCPGEPSQAFRNMFSPIWDDGANGTPVNDENIYALYVYNLVKIYDKQVRFWEVMNEPDEDYSGNGWKTREYEGNWFDNVPDPCDFKLRAPIQHYVRMLRITYEVVKRFAPDDYVAVGGLGSPGFLDLILRHTDNPDGGRVSEEYPHLGGAWFDAMSYHVYPHIDGQMRQWSNDAGGFVYERNSDKAVDRVLEKKQDFAGVLDAYGYNGQKYPEKVWLITETNVPRRGFNYYGSDAFQRNYFVKTAVMGQKAGLAQVHWYQLGDHTKEEWAGSEFELMGLYGSLKHHAFNDAPAHESAIANRTLSRLTKGYAYDSRLTEALELSGKVRGAAFVREGRDPVFVLWAKTTKDESESASFRYDFPDGVLTGEVEIRPWHYSKSQAVDYADAGSVPLNGNPVYITASESITTPVHESEPNKLAFRVFPNPSRGHFRLDFSTPLEKPGELRFLDAFGREFLREAVEKGATGFQVSQPDLAGGLYFVKLEQDGGQSWSKRIMIQR